MRFVRSFRKHAALFDHHNNGDEFALAKGDPTPYQPLDASTQKATPASKKEQKARERADAVRLVLGTEKAAALMDTAQAVASQGHWVYNEGSTPELEWAKVIEEASKRARYLKARKNVL